MFYLSYCLQETYPSSPPVWFAESEETSVTNAVQILSNTNGRDNHVINQVSQNAYKNYRLCLYVIIYLQGWHIATRAMPFTQCSTATRY